MSRWLTKRLSIMESKSKAIYDTLPVWVQNSILSVYSVKLDFERYGGKFKEYKKLLNKSQWFSPEEMKSYQESKLRDLIEYSYIHVPYYRRMLDERNLKPVDIQCIEDLQKLPVLTKRDVKTNYNDLISDEVDKRSLKTGHTGGTTGSPLEICYSNDLIYINYHNCQTTLLDCLQTSLSYHIQIFL